MGVVRGSVYSLSGLAILLGGANATSERMDQALHHEGYPASDIDFQHKSALWLKENGKNWWGGAEDTLDMMPVISDIGMSDGEFKSGDVNDYVVKANKTVGAIVLGGVVMGYGVWVMFGGGLKRANKAYDIASDKLANANNN